jgi:hypothetical protein
MDFALKISVAVYIVTLIIVTAWTFRPSLGVESVFTDQLP